VAPYAAVRSGTRRHSLSRRNDRPCGSGTAGAELPVSGPHGAASTGEATLCAAPDSRDPAPSPTAWNR